MSVQKFAPFVRRALWEAHGRTCAYCDQPLGFKDYQIDHIVPERFLFDPSAYQTLRKEAGLPEGFDLRGYENLLPSCAPCNNKKGGFLMHIPRLLLLLEIAEQKKKVVTLWIQRLEKEDQSDKIKVQLLAGLKSGRLNILEIEKILKELKTSQGQFSVSRG